MITCDLCLKEIAPEMVILSLYNISGIRDICPDCEDNCTEWQNMRLVKMKEQAHKEFCQWLAKQYQGALHLELTAGMPGFD